MRLGAPAPARPPVPPYFDRLIEGFRHGAGGRFVHLGLWEPGEVPAAGSEPGEFEAAQERLNERLLDLAGLRDGLAVLDVGCGFGGTLERIDQRHSAMTLLGVNVDPRQLEICASLRPRAGNRMGWRQADACRLGLPDERFDRVLCIEAMFHFSSRRAFFAEAARVLRPGGLLVVSDIVLAPSVRKLAVPGFAVEAALRDGYGPWPDLFGEDADHTALARVAGLACTGEVDATEGTRRSHRFTVPSDADPARDPGDPSLRAAMMLKWLHEEGHLRYPCLRFEKRAAAPAAELR